MIISFADSGTEDIFDGADTKAARRTCPQQLWPAATVALDVLNHATALQDFKGLGYGLHKLRHDRSGQRAIKINRQYRICFVWVPDGPRNVEIADYH